MTRSSVVGKGGGAGGLDQAGGLVGGVVAQGGAGGQAGEVVGGVVENVNAATYADDADGNLTVQRDGKANPTTYA